MNKLHVLVCAAVALVAAPLCARAQAIDPSITYQGELQSGGAVAAGPVDLRFRLYSAATGGSQIGPQLARLGQALDGGRFTVQLDFGTSAFTGEARWLEIDVRSTGAGTYTTLSPRQRVSPAPVAVAALKPWTIRGVDAYFTGGRIGIGEQFPMAPLHVTNVHRDFDPSVLAQDDIVLEDTDAIIGLISDGGGVAGSGVTLKQLDGMGELLDNWAMYRGTAGAGSELRFTYGPEPSYALNPPVLVLKPSGDVRVTGEIQTPTRIQKRVTAPTSFIINSTVELGLSGVLSPATTGFGFAWASLDLPAGARITRLRARVADVTTTGSVKVSIWNWQFGADPVSEVSAATSTSGLSLDPIVLSTPANITITEGRAYMLSYEFLGSSGIGDRFAAEVEVTYETTTIR